MHGDGLKANVFDPLRIENTVVYDASSPVRQEDIEEAGQFQRWDPDAVLHTGRSPESNGMAEAFVKTSSETTFGWA